MTKYRCIGKGLCGSVWALGSTDVDTGTAVKREDGAPDRSATNDYNMHLSILRSSLTHPLSTPLSIPKCHQLFQATDTWWQTRLPQFPVGYSASKLSSLNASQKVPRSTSNKIVVLFCTGNTPLSDFVKTNADNDACLIRPYLGRRRRYKYGASTSMFQRFSLRDVPLHVDQMEALDLDTNAYAETMTDALALMHWGAKIDANDVEFVLAPSREIQPSGSPVSRSDHLGSHSMWILDFDCCRDLSMDDAGIEQACAAFHKNDPFYPRPGSDEAADERLSVIFKKRFLQTSGTMLGEGSEDKRYLAEKLVETIEKKRLVSS